MRALHSISAGHNKVARAQVCHAVRQAVKASLEALNPVDHLQQAITSAQNPCMAFSSSMSGRGALSLQMLPLLKDGSLEPLVCMTKPACNANLRGLLL